MSEDHIPTKLEKAYKDRVTARKETDQELEFHTDKQGGTLRDKAGRIIMKILTPEASQAMHAARYQPDAPKDPTVTQETPWGMCMNCDTPREDPETEEYRRRTNEAIHCDVCGHDPSTGYPPELQPGRDPEGYYLVTEEKLRRNTGRNQGPPKSRFSASNFRRTGPASGPYDVPEGFKYGLND